MTLAGSIQRMFILCIFYNLKRMLIVDNLGINKLAIIIYCYKAS